MNNKSKYYFFLFLWGLLPFVALLSWWIPPDVFVLFQWLGLLMPFITLINTSIIVTMIIKKWFSYTLFVLYFVGLAYYVPLVLQWSPLHTKMSDKNLKVASYNVRKMQGHYGFSTLDKIAEFITQENVDVLFLQEVPADYSIETLSEHFVEMQSILRSEDEMESSSRLVILSKYPLKSYTTFSQIDRPHFALFGTLNYNGKDIRVVNCHLQTTNWNQSHDLFPSDMFGLVSLISDNYVRRESQVKAIHATLAKDTLPTLLAGDFNDPPVSYTYNKLRGDFKDAFLQGGNGYGATYRYLGGIFRIDYIFLDKDYFKVVNYKTVDVPYSDHLPVIVDLIVKNKNEL